MDNNENILNLTMSGKNMINVKKAFLFIAVSAMFSGNAMSALYVEQDSPLYNVKKDGGPVTGEAIIYGGKYTGDTKQAEIKKIEKQKFFYDTKKAESKPVVAKTDSIPFIKEPSKKVITAEPTKPVFIAKKTQQQVPQYQNFTFNKGRFSGQLRAALANKGIKPSWNLVWKSGTDYEITVPYTITYKTPFELVHKLQALYNFNYRMHKDNTTVLIYDKQ